jgi:hypothetical protein
MSLKILKIIVWSCLFNFICGQICLAKSNVKLILPEEGSFVIKNEILQTSGRGVMHYGEYIIKSDFIKMNKKTGDLHFFGAVVIESENRVMKTLYVDYNYKTKKGLTGFIRGEVVQKEELNVLDKIKQNKRKRNYYFTAINANLFINKTGKPKLILIKPSFSDCDRIPAHHDIYASSAEFSSSEGVKMWNIRPRMFKVPYFYLPFFYKDLKYDWPWTKWEFGSKSEWGRFIKVKTNALPSSVKKNLKVGYEFRELRGNAFTADWARESEKVKSNINLHLIDENWKTINKKILFKENRLRFDFLHEQKFSEGWKGTVEHHILTSSKNYIWSDGVNNIINNDRFVSPLAGSAQIRDSLLQEYYEDEFKHGKRLENILALDYQGKRNLFTISRVEQVDHIPITRLVKDLNVRGFLLPAPILKSDFYYSNAFGYDDFHFGADRNLSGKDKNILFGNSNASKFNNRRVNFEQKFEYVMNFGQYLSLTPSVGQRSIYYEKSLKLNVGARTFANVNESTEIQKWKGTNSLLLGALISNSMKGYFSLGKHDIKHTIRPSIDISYDSPSSFKSSQLVNFIDSLDSQFNSRVKVTYRIGNEILSRYNKKNSRVIYTSFINLDSYLKREDRIIAFGPNLASVGDLEFNQQIYPLQFLRLSSDLRMNSFYKEVPQIRLGLGLNRGTLDFSWDYYYNKTIITNPDSVNRHDLSLKYTHSKFDTLFNVSLEEDPFLDKKKRAGLYKSGIRNVDIVFGRLFHLIRGEVNFKYDIESSGSTLIFSFGPQILGDQLPKYRHPLSNF